MKKFFGHRLPPGAVRLLLRLGCFAAAALLALPGIPQRWGAWSVPLLGPQRTWGMLLLPALSPQIALGSALARREAGVILAIGLPALMLVLLRKRFLCRFVCPVGLINDQASRLNKAGRGRFVAFPQVGRWLALLTLGGAALGYPLFLWLDPFSLFNGVFNLWHKPFTAALAAPAAVLLGAVLVNVWRPHLWCQRLCPLGALQEMLNNVKCQMSNGQWPMSTVKDRKLAEVQKIPTFTGAAQNCGTGILPVMEAPQRAMTVNHGQDARATRIGNSYTAGRRAVLGLGVGTMWALAGRKVVGRERAAGPILPPGAAGPLEMNALCVRCGNCVRVCPTKIIRPDTGKHGLAALLTPVLDFSEEYCHPDCHACGQVCPSGAIARLTLAQKNRFAIGLARVNPDDCQAVQSGDCSACSMGCMYDAIESGRGERGAPLVRKEKCVGCGACELLCPADPKAIVVRRIR